MSSSQVNESDIERLTDKDKVELRQFLANEEQRAQIQAQTHHVTQLCWKKCVTGPIKQGTLDRSEESCMSNCVDRFFDLSLFTMKHIQKRT
ncbi:Tim10/DDP family zinc finger protein [Stachybotrys elegans]|uniref:Mitochondrial import inner membrane translocase subunit n=1 Tax=Stachybotrys elegans TaxID=80388 RepID=A0A8K0SHF8_9HYPO|nr:Tim10/DDP family zinc finger protein [Stachybotrys elegans]